MKQKTKQTSSSFINLAKQNNNLIFVIMIFKLVIVLNMFY